MLGKCTTRLVGTFFKKGSRALGLKAVAIASVPSSPSATCVLSSSCTKFRLG